MAFPSSKLLLTLTILSIAASGNILPCTRSQTVGSDTTIIVAGQAICPMPSSILPGTSVAQLIKPIANSKADLVCGAGTTEVTLTSTMTNNFGGVGRKILRTPVVGNYNLYNVIIEDGCKLRMTVPANVCTKPAVNGVLDLAVGVINATADPLILTLLTTF